MGEKMTLAGELKRKVYDEYLSLYDGDKDKALQDLGTFYLGWRAIEKDLTQPAQAVDVEPDPALLASMATCLHHGFGLLDARQQQSMLHDMRKLWDEVMGRGYYRPENRERYMAYVHPAALPRDSNGAEGVGS